MVLRRHLLSMMTLLTLFGSSTSLLAQASNAPLEPLSADPAGQTPKFVGVFGAVNRPGIYSFLGEHTTAGELIQQAGGELPEANSIGLVRPLPPEQIALQKQGFEAQGMTEEQYCHEVRKTVDFQNQTLASIVYPGDILVVNSPQTTPVQPVGGNDGTSHQVDLMIVNLLGRPVYLSWQPTRPEESTLKYMLESMRQTLNPEMVNSIVIIDTRSKAVSGGKAQRYNILTEPLPAGAIVVLDPAKIKFDNIPQAVLNKMPGATPFQVASKPQDETRTDVPQSNLMSNPVMQQSVPEIAETLTQEEPILVPQPTDETLAQEITAPVVEEAQTGVPIPETEQEQVASRLSEPPEQVQILPPAPEMGISMDLSEGQQFALGTPDIPPAQTALPAYTEAIDSGTQMYDPLATELAQNPTEGGRWNSANLVVIGLLVLTGLTLAWTRFNNQRTAIKSKSARPTRPQTRPHQRQAVQEMATEATIQQEEKLESHRQKIERRRKIHATSRDREHELEVEALINDMLPVKEEEVQISRTFHLPGIGQSFRIDPGSSELRGPHFNQAARRQQQSREQQMAGQQVNQPAATNESQVAPPQAFGQPDSNKIHHLHQGGHSPMNKERQSAPNKQGSYQQ